MNTENTVVSFTRTSPLSGVTRTRDIDVGDLDLYFRWTSGEGMIQNMLPTVSVDDREFIKTGIVAEGWDDAFPEEWDK